MFRIFRPSNERLYHIISYASCLSVSFASLCLHMHIRATRSLPQDTSAKKSLKFCTHQLYTQNPKQGAPLFWDKTEKGWFSNRSSLQVTFSWHPQLCRTAWISAFILNMFSNCSSTTTNPPMDQRNRSTSKHV